MAGAEYVNFYENMVEAQRRLLNTIVLYDKEPYNVLNIADHRGDGVFRVYLVPVATHRNISFPDNYFRLVHGSDEQAKFLDDWLKTDEGKKTGILRKKMNSPLFNKFRPFPLGMLNCTNGKTYYLERTPTRNTEQGLGRNAVIAHLVALSEEKDRGRGWSANLEGPDFRACVLGEHPSIQDVVTNLRDPEITRNSAAFHRNFALICGPVSSLFLVYKTEVIGLVSGDPGNLNVVIGRKFRHYKEVVELTSAFSSVTLQS